MTSQDDAGREERETNYRDEEKNITGIEHTFAYTLEMSHDTEGGNRLHEPRVCPLDEKICHWGVTDQNEEKADYHREDKADNLVAG